MENIPQWVITIIEIAASTLLGYGGGELPPAEPFVETNYSALVVSSLCTEPDGKVILTYQENGTTSSQYILVKYTATCLGDLPQSLLLKVDSPAHVNFLAPDGTALPTDYNVKADVPHLFSSNVIGEFSYIQIIPQ